MNSKKILIGLLLAFLLLFSNASHRLGGEITWSSDGNGQFIFQFKL